MGGYNPVYTWKDEILLVGVNSKPQTLSKITCVSLKQEMQWVLQAPK